MTAALLETPNSAPFMDLTSSLNTRYVDAARFCELMVSNRRMERLDRADRRVRGLRDLDTGEVFLIDARRLLEACREHLLLAGWMALFRGAKHGSFGVDPPLLSQSTPIRVLNGLVI